VPQYPDPSFWDLTATDVAATVGTLLALGVAVYVGVLRDYVRRPKLSLTFAAGSSDTIVVTAQRIVGGARAGRSIVQTIDFPAAYLRIRVRNGGEVTAEDVEVTISDAREQDIEDQIVRLDGLPLVFSNTVPNATRMHVSPGGTRHLDIAHVDFDGQHAERPVWIDIHPRPADRRLASMGEGTLELELTVTARNVEAVRYALKLHFTGDNADTSIDTIWDRLRVEDFRRLN
jgi:hypothetical protein